MIRMRVSEAARLLGADYRGPDRVFQGCGIDSRVVSAGAMFVALPGQHADGHDFVGVAADRGAAAAMLERDGDHGALPTIKVPNCHRALGQLAGIWRGRFQYPLIAITGSNGKTTVKELLAAILEGRGPTHATRGNLNNELGVPLTLFGLDDRHHWAVVEMGANHPGEIARLARMARPTVGIVTRCAPAHLEGFGGIEGVARAKGELFENLDDAGTAIINADDPYAGLWRELAGNRRIMTFGLDKPADVSADYSPMQRTHRSTTDNDTPISRGETTEGIRGARHRLPPDRVEFTLKTPVGRQDTGLALPGRHNVLNALAAAAAALAVGCSLESIARGLASVDGVDGRLQIKEAPNGARIIDDTYNANPDSLAAALAVLANYPEPRWLVLGDMAELGEQGPELHEQAGKSARELGVTRLFATGPLCRYAVEAFGAGGHDGGRYHADPDELLGAVRAELTGGTAVGEITILVKGSRSMRMERIADGILKCCYC